MAEINPLTFGEMAILRTELALPAYAAMTDDQRANAISSPTQIANPVAQPTIPLPFAAVDIFGLLSPTSLGKFMSLPVAASVIERLDAADIQHTLQWIAAAAALAVISSDEAAAIQSRVQQTHLDPTWPATVAGPRRVSQLYGSEKTWLVTTDDGSSHTVDFVPLVAVEAAR